MSDNSNQTGASNPSRDVRLYGTEEPADAVRHVRAGGLSLSLQNGALRNIRFNNVEAIRGIAFIVRDKDWGTFNPLISNLVIEPGESQFRISFDAVCKDEQQELRYRATIAGAADGSLRFDVEGCPETPFLTSRTGFVVLHPVQGVAGAPVKVTHTDGSIEDAVFPATIKPSQPFMDIRSLRHELAPGVFVTCTMRGDAFEMEDQRNWSDASYKTYIRPLAKPHPYVLDAGKSFPQSVTLAIDGNRRDAPGAGKETAIEVSLGTETAGQLPELALAAAPEYLAAAIASAGLVREAGIRRLVCYYDPAAGDDAATLSAYGKLAASSGAELALEAVLPLRDEAGEFSYSPELLDEELAALRQAVVASGTSFVALTASPACYHKSYQPSGPWPAAPALRDVYAGVRSHFPGVRVGAGMHSFFTEFNRRPPPVEGVDFVTHSTSPIVHAGDDLSVMETLEALPWIIRSVHERAPAMPYWIGPSAIGMRFNPYGAATVMTEGNTRAAMVTRDPRQRGLFNAAWTLGYLARAAAGDVSGVCLSAVAGPFGIGWQPMAWPQPWFDERGSKSAVFPVYHVLAGLAQHAGARVRANENSAPHQLAVLGVDKGDGCELWLANLTAEACQVELAGASIGRTIRRLDAATFERCCLDSNGLSATAEALPGSRVTLDAYGVACIA